MPRKTSCLGRGGIHQTLWDNMSPPTRELYNRIYPEHDYLRSFGRTYLPLTPINTDSSILAKYPAQPRHATGYGVIALDGSCPNHAGRLARAQYSFKTIESARRHLLWRRFASPWISVFSSWALALRRARYLTQSCGATQVFIMLIDMEPIESECVDAYQFAQAYIIGNPSVYRGEMLCFNDIPESCLLAYIPAQLPPPKFAPSGRLKVPEDFLDEALLTYSQRLSLFRGEQCEDMVRDCDAVRCWLFDAMWSRYISSPLEKVGQVMQGFDEGWDEI